jgi:hypothetical protein
VSTTARDLTGTPQRTGSGRERRGAGRAFFVDGELQSGLALPMFLVADDHRPSAPPDATTEERP